ncbi:MAG: ribosomal RNA small subunit methyltransferase A [Armatimonadetes bacterium]|nr:ribosomal RNA small subunit methyltransferase A [Anaerolineae bacterium]
MTNPKALLDSYAIAPKKALGQNFLHDPNALEKIVASAELMPTDTVVEIGAGTGLLTERLAQAAGRVIAIELDERLQPVLEGQLSMYRNVTLVFEDVLRVNIVELVGDTDFSVVANVPYYITSAILRHLLEPAHRPRRLVLTVQQEVAERVMAPVGDLNLLAVSVQYYGKPRIVSKLNPAVFWPRPEVSSAVLRIDTYPQPLVSVPEDAVFFRVVRAGFSQKRKQLKNAVSSGLMLSQEATDALFTAADVDARRRAETLTLAEWASLARAYAAQTDA